MKKNNFELQLKFMKTIKEKELNEIFETENSLNELNELIATWAAKRGWHIFINRVNKKGWVVYGINKDAQQLMQYCGIGVIEKYFDSPITSLNSFINKLN